MHMCRQQSFEKDQTEFYIEQFLFQCLNSNLQKYSYDNQRNLFSVFWVYGDEDCIMVTIIRAVELQNWVLHQVIRVSPIGMVNMTP